MYSTELTETIEYYVIYLKNSSICFNNRCLKGFDCVSHIKLFNILQAYGVCPLIIRLLCNMYTHSDMQVRWNLELSNNEWCKAGILPVSYAIYLVHGWIDTEAKT